MTSCERLSDRMIAVSRGLGSWSDEEARHLSACADCGAEWRLVRRGQELGAGLGSPDLDRVVSGVRARLAAAVEGGAARVAPMRRRRPSRLLLAGLAAAAVVMLAVRFGDGRSGSRGEAEPTRVLTELEELTASELETVLTDLEAAGPPDDGSLGDLNADELEQVLRSWES